MKIINDHHLHQLNQMNKNLVIGFVRKTQIIKENYNQ